MGLIFDSHTHYCDAAYDADRAGLLASLKERSVGRVTEISACLEDLAKVRKLSAEYDFVYGAYGIHPGEVSDLNDSNFTEIEAALKAPKAVAVGEIGLDYHYEDADKALQKKWFAAQIDLAKSAGFPIVVHSRDAAKDTLDIIKAENAKDAGGVIHCFSYEKEFARIYMDMGFYIGVGGVLTFKKSRKLCEVVEYMPLDMMLLETDCPYLAPEPHRGERNDSGLLNFVVDKIRDIKKVSRDEVISVTEANARRMYRV